VGAFSNLRKNYKEFLFEVDIFSQQDEILDDFITQIVNLNQKFHMLILSRL